MKHVRARNQTFPGLSLFKQHEHRLLSDEESYEYSIVEVPVESRKNNADTTEQRLSTADKSLSTPGADVEAITNFPAVPSTIGACEEEPNIDEDDSDFEDASDDTISGSDGPYNLRNVRRVKYSNAAITNIVDKSDSPKLSKVFKSSQRDNWIGAISVELDVIMNNGTWKETLRTGLPSDATILPSGIIPMIKQDEKGNISKYKAHLVVRGNFQEKYGNYAAFYAPVACVELVWLMLSVAASKRYRISQLYMRGAYLHAHPPDFDQVYVRLPRVDGILLADGRVVKLVNSLCGLKQAPKLWYRHVALSLEKIGFKKSRFCDCLFIRSNFGDTVYILAYVDDLLVLGNDADVEVAKQQLAKLVSVPDLGKFHFFLGVKLDHWKDELFLS